MKLQNLIHILMGIVCIGLLPRGQAVSPPPPGGYPNFTTAAGDHALQALTLGVGNTAIGTYSLFSATTNSNNTAVGAGALDLNIADSNTATGAAALLFNTEGTQNTANGTAALENNTTGNNNTATGYQALVFNTTGAYNTASGYQALYSNTNGNENTASGDGALHSNQSGGYNTALGEGALYNNTAGTSNTAIGFAAGFNTTGNDNILINDIGQPGENNTIRIGSDVHTAIYIAGIAGRTVGQSGTTCYVDNAGKLGVFLSARRFKTDIADMGNASEALLALRPVTFHYRPELDKTGIPQFGLIAEEVAKVNPDLVTHDAKGELSTVRYEAVNAMLLNEFLKEHRKVEKLEAGFEQQRKDFQATAAQQQNEIQALTASLKEQTAQIQKVSAQLAAASQSHGGLEASKPASQTVNNP